MSKILVVDDQPGMRSALKAILEQGGHSISEAGNGNEARELLGTREFDLVVTDYQMPEMNGLDLLVWIKANKPMPVVLITAFTQILETKRAFDLGADGFLAKPFTSKEILQTVEQSLKPTKAPAVEPEAVAAMFCRIPIEDFVSSSGVQVSVYVKLSEIKYVRVAHKGDQIAADRVENYKNKGLNYLYARKDEFGKLVGFNLDLAKVIQRNTKISAEKKVRFIKYTTELAMENVMVNGVRSEPFKQALDCVNVCLSMVSESEGLFNLLDVLNEHSDWIYAHSVGVGLYSVMIGRKMGWDGQATLFKLGVAGLFHDVGEKEIEKDILAKARPALSFEERKLVETHPSRGRDILQELGDLSEDVIQIIHEHHEDCTGQGFPRQLTREKIHPLAKVLAVADRFCELAMVSPRSKGLGAIEAVQYMRQHYNNEMDKGAFAALGSFCYIPSPEA